jgi:lipopolysaccharide heptosyltransferase I
MEAEPRNVLIVKLSSMGDILHALPAACALRDRFPAARISWIVDHRFAPILRDHPAIDHLVAVSVPAQVGRLWFGQDWLRGISQCRQAAQLWHERFDLAIDLQGLLRSATIARMTGAIHRIGPSTSREGAHWLYSERLEVDPTKHVVEQHLQVIQAIGPAMKQPSRLHDIRFDLAIRPVDRDRARLVLLDRRWSPDSTFVVVAPQSSRATKDWPAERFRELITSISRRYQLPVLLIGGRTELARCRAIADSLGPQVRVAIGQSLGVVMALLEMAQVMIGPDTGPVHLASALGRPTVSIFGPTDSRRLHPWGCADLVVHRSDSCHACQRSQTRRWNLTPVPHTCLKMIEPADVMVKVEQALDRSLRRAA